MSENLKRTPLYQCHVDLKARIVPFAGYEMPVQYHSVITETVNCRKSAGLFDVSHMGQLRIRGKEALPALQTIVTNDLSKLKDGQAQYNLLCNNQGTVIDDLIVYRNAEDHWYICMNASNKDKDVEWFKMHLPKELDVVDESDETGLIAIQGPLAESLVSQLSDENTVKNLKYYWACNAEVDGKKVYLSRTGYTGEDGFEIYCKNSDAVSLWNTLLEIGSPKGLVPVGLGARDTLRTEMGYPLHGHELSETINGYEAGLGWVIKLAKGPFIGSKALERVKAEGPAKKLFAFKTSDRRIPRTGYKIVNEGKEIGEITSGTQSPHLNCPIALGFIKTESANLGSYHVQIREAAVPLEVASLPFVKSSVKK